MDHQRLGSTGLQVSPIAFGAFKIGRNQGIKYPSAYQLPNQETANKLLNNVLDLGINLIDTAPAYGVSEQRIGDAIAHRRDQYILATKIGEQFANGKSSYDFSMATLVSSIETSLRLLKTETVDLLHIHSDGNDMAILNETDAVEAINTFKTQGKARFIGFSGKTIEGALASLEWADTLMVEYNQEQTEARQLIDQAASQGVGVLVKKPLGSGHLEPQTAIEEGLSVPGVSTLVVGSLNAAHLEQNLQWARAAH
ncbi:MAG: aldo/keto reductase [Phycisphaerales bacterium]|nr:aldo/keto reductase [Phycisphaerales bacterium]